MNVVNILSVDDTPENHHAIKTMIRSEGIVVDEAYSGKEALKKLLKKDYACVLLDLNMPEMDGFEAAKCMRADPKIRDLPIIFVTAHEFADIEQLFDEHQIGAFDYIVKPIKPIIFHSKIQTYVKLYQQRESLESSNRQLLTTNTELNKVKKRLLEIKSELERSNNDLEQFAYVASHDLKSPLRAMDNLVNFIREDAEKYLPEQSKSDLEILKKRIRRMEGLLDDLLRYARIGKVESKIEDVELAILLKDIVDFLSFSPHVSVIFAPNMPLIRTPKVPLQLVLRNLISNAVKHNERPDCLVEITHEDQGSFVEFKVRDNGPGIPSEFHDLIFHMFKTLKPRDEKEGSGLGLAMVKKMVETFGGEISVESTIGQGTSFRFLWPKYEIQTEEANAYEISS